MIIPFGYFETSEAAPSGWQDIDGATFINAFDVSTEETVPLHVNLSSDGSKMYVLGTTGNGIDEYDLSTPYDVTSATHSYFFVLTAVGTSPYGFWFKNDGTKFFAVKNGGNDDVYSYSLSSAWDLSTASYDSVSFAQSGLASCFGLFLIPDGTRMYTTDSNSNKLRSYTLSTGWDLSTASYDGDPASFTLSSQIWGNIVLSDDGTKMYIVNQSADLIEQYPLSTPFNLSTIGAITTTYDYFDSGGGESSLCVGIYINEAGTRVYMVSTASSINDDSVLQYDF